METIIDNLLTKKVEWVKELIYETSCPHDFGYQDVWWNCNPNDSDACKKCWNREVVESEEVCGK